MPLTRKPSITESSIADRPAKIAVANVRQRIEAIEGLLATIESQANQSSFSLTQRNATLANLASQLAQLQAVIEDLLANDDGIVVLSGDSLITRTLQEGAGITITNPDGVDGDPVIAADASGECCYPFLTTEDDQDILTESGLRIRVE